MISYRQLNRSAGWKYARKQTQASKQAACCQIATPPTTFCLSLASVALILAFEIVIIDVVVNVSDIDDDVDNDYDYADADEVSESSATASIHSVVARSD